MVIATKQCIMDKMNEFWSMNEGTFYCLYDAKRTLAFKRAIKNTVRKGDVVVELGAGSGVLSMFAADAGAAHVYAVELDKANLAALRSTIDSNGYGERINVIEGDATSVQLPEKVDVIICELIATGLVEELQIPAMNHALSYAKKGCRVLLKEYHITLDLVSERNNFYNKQFDVIRYEFPDKPSLRSKKLTDTSVIREVDFSQKVKSSFLKEEVVFTIKQSGVLNGIRLAGETIFADGSTFSSSISYSFPAILPIKPREVKKGEKYIVTISYSMCEGPNKLKYSIDKAH